MPRIRTMLRRYTCSILYHVTLLLLVFTFLSKYSDISIITKGGGQSERRDVDMKRHRTAVDPSLPLDEIDDEVLDELDAEMEEYKSSETETDGVPGEIRGNVITPVVGPLEHSGGGGNPHNASEVLTGRGDPPNVPANYLPAPKFRNVPMIPRVRVVEGEGPGIHLQKEPLANYTHPLRADLEGAVQSLSVPAQEVTRRANVLIIAAMRTGSSFLGELFQQRGDFFYMFEPGMQIMHKLDSLNLTRRVIYTKLIEMLHEFYRCKFDSVPFFVDELNQTTLFARKQAIPALGTSQFCRQRLPGQRPRDACDDVSEKVLETACTTRANTAIKSIRILDINLMISAVKDPSLNLKLIHLVRDPRSMILSRLKLSFPAIKVFNVTELSDTYRNILLKYCSNWLQNYEIGHYVPLMRKNYLMVRYEDLALEPYIYARKIYDFVGLGAEIPPTMLTWLDLNTNVNDPSQKKAAAFSTKRDSKEVLVSWKSRLTLEMAKAIEEVGDCTRLMKATGYKLIGDDYQILNNTDHLVDIFPVPDLDINAFDFM